MDGKSNDLALAAEAGAESDAGNLLVAILGRLPVSGDECSIMAGTCALAVLGVVGC